MSERSKSSLDVEWLLRRAAQPQKTVEYKKKQVIYAQGDPADTVFYVLCGRVKITIVCWRGQEAVIGIRGAEDFLGEGCLAGKPLRMSTATAIEPLTLIAVPKRQIQRLLREEPAFAKHFMCYVLERNARFEEDLADQLFNSTERRLARALVLLAQRGRSGKAGTVVPRISQETLAGMIGTTRSRVSHFMNQFRRMGFIRYNGGLQVNRSLLKVMLHD